MLWFEYYESEKKWWSKVGVLKWVIVFDCCLNINKCVDVKYKYLIVFYIKDEYFVVVVENE